MSQQIAGDVSSAQVPPHITRGMVIDAGSGGSRLHIYTWEPRIFAKVPPVPISYPTTEEHFTGKIKPGISVFADEPEGVKEQLYKLMYFAKNVLRDFVQDWKYFPIYLKATGGMREVPVLKRDELMRVIRSFLSDKALCPFYFRNEFARVISGEEEAVYAWTATNFLMNRLLPPLQGLGDAEPINSTYGTVDLGGASCQIAFYVPSQDISEGLFRLHIGDQKHWTLYAKSYLQYGHVSARKRHLLSVADDASVIGENNLAVVPRALDYCFHAGYSENVLNSAGSKQVEISGPAVSAEDQLERCMRSLAVLMRKEGPDNTYCEEVYDGECGIGGAYQPKIPLMEDSGFVGISSYKYAWSFLRMPTTSTLDEFRQRAKEICSMSFGDILQYYEEMNAINSDLSDYLPYYCFLSSYTLTLLQTGFGFRHNQTLTVTDVIGDHDVGWALGAMMFEINVLPWELASPNLNIYHGYLLPGCIGMIIGAIIAYFIVKLLVTEPYINSPIKGDRHAVSSPIKGDVSSRLHQLSNASDRSFQSSESLGNTSNHSSRSWVGRIIQFNPFFRSGYVSVPSESNGYNNNNIASVGGGIEI